MPGLHLRALEGGVEADLDDPVVGTEDTLAHGDEPGVGDELGEATDGLGMDFDVPAAGAAADGSSGMLDRLPEGGHHVFTHLLDELAREGSLAGDDAVTLQGLNVGVDVAGQKVLRAWVRCGGHGLLDAGDPTRVCEFLQQSRVGGVVLGYGHIPFQNEVLFVLPIVSVPNFDSR